jgi:hypothetical protein
MHSTTATSGWLLALLALTPAGPRRQEARRLVPTMGLPAWKSRQAISGRGEIPHRRYLGWTRCKRQAPGARERLGMVDGTNANPRRVSRPGAMPGPTVTVRMKETAPGSPCKWVGYSAQSMQSRVAA